MNKYLFEYQVNGASLNEIVKAATLEAAMIKFATKNTGVEKVTGVTKL